MSRQLALATAERLLRVRDVVSAIPNHAAGSLSHGLAGTALLHARLSATNPAFADAASRHWAAAGEFTRRHRGNHPGIYRAPGGLAASLIIGTPYLPDPDIHAVSVQRSVRWLASRAIDVADQYIQRLRADWPSQGGTPWDVYDAINGLAGIGRVLLAAVTSGHQAAEPGLRAALDTLTTILRNCHGARPGWWLAPHGHPPGMAVHPSGAANTGMAHGVAGPLALLATAYTTSWTVPGQLVAIREAADWLLRWRTTTDLWPPYVAGYELDTGALPATSGRHDAWCYGTPGIARALALAGHALRDTQLVHAADSALASMTDRPTASWDVEGATLCHGHAGILQATAATCITDMSTRATNAVAAEFNPKHLFGLVHVDKSRVRQEPGFLTGAAGVALALADHGQLPAADVPARWDCLLLLS